MYMYIYMIGSFLRACEPTLLHIKANHNDESHTHTPQLLSPSTYTEMSRFDPIGAGFMLSIDDDGYFTVSSDPRVRACCVCNVLVFLFSYASMTMTNDAIPHSPFRPPIHMAGGHRGGGAQGGEGGQDPGDRRGGSQGL